MRFTLLFITNLFFLGSFAQDESKWRLPADRDINFPAEEYWRHFEKFEYGNKIKDGKLKKKERQALTQAKGQLSKKIYTSVSSESNRDVIRKEEIYNSMFSSSTDEKSNVNLKDLTKNT